MLWRSIWVLNLRSDLSSPLELTNFVLKHINKVRSHSFISYNDLLTSIDDEIPALVENAFFEFILIDELISLQATKLAFDHDRNFSKRNSLRFFFDDAFSIFFNDLDVKWNIWLVSDISKSSFMGKYHMSSLIMFYVSWILININSTKHDFKHSFHLLSIFGLK